MSEFAQIGTVEILRARLYPVDPANHGPIQTEVVVEAGEYPLLSDGYSHLWLMKGLVNGNSIRRGDGMIVMAVDANANPLEGLEVTALSRVFGPDEWRDMLSDPTAREGHPEQRLRFKLNAAAT